MEPKVFAKEKLETRRPHQCCCIIGDPREHDWHYCPATRSTQMHNGRRTAYCDEHFRKFFVAPKRPVAAPAIEKAA